MSRVAKLSQEKILPLNRENPLFVASLERGFAILEAFGASQSEMGVTELAAVTGFDKSAAQRFAHTLHVLGYLERIESARKYRLSRRTLGLAYSYLRSDPLIEAVSYTHLRAHET